MYCQDTLERLNQDAVDRYNEKNPDCEYCDKPATITIPVYNPADTVRTPPITGAYCTYSLCVDCEEEGHWREELFYCAGCSELFIYNHSWDVLAVTVNDELYCQECAIEEIEPRTLAEVIEELQAGLPENWLRINSIPGRDEIWTGEYSEYSDFPGHTGFNSIISELEKIASDMGRDTEVYPVVSQGYQFSVVLSVFK